MLLVTKYWPNNQTYSEQEISNLEVNRRCVHGGIGCGMRALEAWENLCLLPLARVAPLHLCSTPIHQDQEITHTTHFEYSVS
jgi:hypothetical protein